MVLLTLCAFFPCGLGGGSAPKDAVVRSAWSLHSPLFYALSLRATANSAFLCAKTERAHLRQMLGVMNWQQGLVPSRVVA